jgi:AcrR family transcriptional regulator
MSAAIASPWKDQAAREAERSDKRDAVLRVAAQSFCEKGVRATSLDDIAERLSITKPTLYHYFRSKDDILAECVLRGLAMIEEAIAAPALRDVDGLERLKVALRSYAEVMTMDFGMCVTRIAEPDLSAEGRKAFRAHKRKIDQRIRGLVEEGIRDGTVRPCDVRIATFTLTGALNWIARWYEPGGNLSAADIADQVVATLVEGIATRH